MKKVLLVISTWEYFCSHRLNLAKTLLDKGYIVGLATRVKADFVNTTNIKVFPLQHLHRKSLSVPQNLLLLFELYKIYNTFKPDITHHVALKPIIFGSIISYICKVKKVINALGGLGFLFTANVHQTNLSWQQHLYTIVKKPLRLLTILMLRITTTSSLLVLQNPDDMNTLRQYGLKSNLIIIPGAGVNLQDFPLQPLPESTIIKIVCVSRMLYSKGIKELVEAAVLLKQQYKDFQIILYGEPDEENPDHITRAQLQFWHNEDLIVWRGYCPQVSLAYQESHIAVLPSYREGLPKSLLEAASSGRPIVTTNTPGCNLVVQDGINGFLVPIKNSVILAEKLALLINSHELRVQFGLASRKLIEEKFSDQIILQQFMQLYI